jgi:hypothetical protein
MADGATRLGQQAVKSEDILPDFGKPGPGAEHRSQAEVARTRKPEFDCCGCGPRLGTWRDRIFQERGTQRPANADLFREDFLQPRRGKVQEGTYFNRQKPVGSIQEIHRH